MVDCSVATFIAVVCDVAFFLLFSLLFDLSCINKEAWLFANRFHISPFEGKILKLFFVLLFVHSFYFLSIVGNRWFVVMGCVRVPFTLQFLPSFCQQHNIFIVRMALVFENCGKSILLSFTSPFFAVPPIVNWKKFYCLPFSLWPEFVCCLWRWSQCTTSAFDENVGQ